MRCSVLVRVFVSDDIFFSDDDAVLINRESLRIGTDKIGTLADWFSRNHPGDLPAGKQMWESDTDAVRNSCDDRPAANNGLCRTIGCFSALDWPICVLMNRLGTKTGQLSKLEVREADRHRPARMLWQDRRGPVPFQRTAHQNRIICVIFEFRPVVGFKVFSFG